VGYALRTNQLDAGLAALDGLATRMLIQAVKRNAPRFPPDFIFQLTPAEVDLWRSRMVTSKSDRRDENYFW
jgi:hypothetical protein